MFAHKDFYHGFFSFPIDREDKKTFAEISFDNERNKVIILFFDHILTKAEYSNGFSDAYELLKVLTFEYTDSSTFSIANESVDDVECYVFNFRDLSIIITDEERKNLIDSLKEVVKYDI
jgi:hypothetical protein